MKKMKINIKKKNLGQMVGGGPVVYIEWSDLTTEAPSFSPGPDLSPQFSES